MNMDCTLMNVIFLNLVLLRYYVLHLKESQPKTVQNESLILQSFLLPRQSNVCLSILDGLLIHSPLIMCIQQALICTNSHIIATCFERKVPRLIGQFSRLFVITALAHEARSQ